MSPAGNTPALPSDLLHGLALALQLLITPGTAAHADTASHKLFGNGFLLGPMMQK